MKKIAAIGVNPLYHGQSKRMIEVGHYYADLEPELVGAVERLIDFVAED